jgi:Glycosyltransferase family 87/WD40-like Beta Propeller Repeat
MMKQMPSNLQRYPVQRWISIAEWALVALLSVHFFARTLPNAWHTLNTDFPNYYLTARLAREHYDTSRVYEWVWLQRQKDHRNIDQRLVGMVPITPFSTLVVYPLTSLPALAAKHCWLVANLGLLFITVGLLRTLTSLPWSRIALVVALSLPLRVNFLYGQYYVLLLFLLTLSYWLYVGERRFLAGVVIGIASGLKIFPVIYLLYFLRKRDIKAFAGGVAGGLVAAGLSIFVFGWELHRTYLFQVLPSALRGEGLDPYNLKAASISSLLHRLFIYEPQLNMHPALNAPWLFAIAHPLLQMILIAPALLLVAPGKSSLERSRLEWAAILFVTLAISTSASSYLLTLLILPACFVLASLQNRWPYWVSGVFILLIVATGTLGVLHGNAQGWSVLLSVPRLYALIFCCAFTFALLIRNESLKYTRRDLTVWSTLLTTVLIVSVASGLRHQHGLYADYQWRIPAYTNVYMASNPAIQGDSVLFVAMMSDGYHSAIQNRDDIEFSNASRDDVLAVTAANGGQSKELVAGESTITSSRAGSHDIPRAEFPVASFDGLWLAYLREDRGRAQVWVRDLTHPAYPERRITPIELNVLEMAFLPKGGLIFSASSGEGPRLLMVDETGKTEAFDLENARYPAISPDGHWLAYSHLEGGNWRLWLRNLDDGHVHGLTDAACNNIQPSWTSDSKSLIYASDCGRALWFTALCKRPVLP